ncbi:MAG: TniQ family protein [Rhodoferax sp.]|nr:TniQ family protein [Rhodoferax sp.]
MRGLTTPLWPIRFKPHLDELLASWLVRLARGHGLRVQTFCNLIFGNRRQVWNRDIDRLGPDWIVDCLSEHTGTPIDVARGTTLRSYEGWLYPAFKASGSLQWMTSLQVFHRTRQGFGMQYCPRCLCGDVDPFFRKAWRVAFITTCPTHQCMLRDRCRNCGVGVAFHRGDMGSLNGQPRESISDCYACGVSLASHSGDPVEQYDGQVMNWIAALTIDVMNGAKNRRMIDAFSVMRQMAVLLTSRYSTLNFHAHVCGKLVIPEMTLVLGKVSFESRTLAERHHLIQLIGWLMLDLEPRLGEAWREKAVRYNLMVKDFKNAPESYLTLVSNFSDWRRA